MAMQLNRAPQCALLTQKMVGAFFTQAAFLEQSVMGNFLHPNPPPHPKAPNTFKLKTHSQTTTHKASTGSHCIATRFCFNHSTNYLITITALRISGQKSCKQFPSASYIFGVGQAKGSITCDCLKEHLKDNLAKLLLRAPSGKQGAAALSLNLFLTSQRSRQRDGASHHTTEVSQHTCTHQSQRRQKLHRGDRTASKCPYIKASQTPEI